MTDKVWAMANLTTWSGALIAGFGALTLTQWLAIGGFVLAVAGFAVNTWHKIAMYRLARFEQMERLKNGN